MREARARFAELLDDAEQGNITLITRYGHAAAAIVPVTLLGQLGKPGEEAARPAAARPAAARELEAAVASLRSALQALETLTDTSAEPAARRTAYQTRPGRSALVAASLADLSGPDHGVVELPLRLFWSAPDRTFDLDQPSMLQALYETVLREASRPDDLTSYLNGPILVAVWPELFLPKGVRRAWEDQHPELRAARLAAA
jgi:antitoxin (DNA-binding transcriptional repressor) of toxin-antitoxin stability system